MIGAGDTRRRQASVVTRISRAARSRLLTLQVELTRSIKDAAEHVRSRHLFVWDVLGLTIASVLALALYIDTARVDFSVMDLWWVVALVVATRSVVNLAIELYHYAWRYAGVADMGRILFCVGFGSVASAASVLLAIGILETFGMPAVRPDLTFWSNELLLALVVMATPRFAIRAVTDLGTPSGAGIGGGGVRTLLYGAGWAGVLVARSAQRGEANVRPVGFLDDDPRITGRRINGLPVYGGLEAMARSIRRSRATALLVTMPSAPGDVIRRVVASAIELGLTVRTVPPMTDILDGTLDASRVRNVRVEDLLRRPMSSEHAPGVKRLFTGRTALITGAGGS